MKLQVGVHAATVTTEVRLPLLQYMPNGDRPPAGWPLVLFLHGAGQKGLDGAALADAALPRLLADGLAVDALIVCPQCPPGPGWPLVGLMSLLEALAARPDVDADRIALVGSSMGARGAWDLACHAPAAISAIVALAGFGVPTLAPLLAAIPARLFHGTEDDVVPAARSHDMMAALAAAGADAELVILEGADHAIDARVLSDRDLWTWMISRRRNLA